MTYIECLTIALLLILISGLFGLMEKLADTKAGQAFRRWIFERIGVSDDK